MRYILGLNCYHPDSSAALLLDGGLVAAIEEERLTRVKHWAGFPSKSIAFCLQQAGISINDINDVAVNTSPLSNLPKKFAFALKQLTNLKFLQARGKNAANKYRIGQLIAAACNASSFDGRVHRVEHHLAHLCSAYFASPFDDAAIVSVDGMGDLSSAAWAVGHGSFIRELGRVHHPHSLGYFYQAITQYLGFPNYGDEYKVMGLAPYGRPSYLPAMMKMVTLHKSGGFSFDTTIFKGIDRPQNLSWPDGVPAYPEMWSKHLEDKLGPHRSPHEPLEQRHKDIARSAQELYETVFFHILSTLHGHSNVDAVAIAGGCGMNSVANGKIRRKTPFQRVYVQAAAGDAGGAIGAAYAVHLKYDKGRSRPQAMPHAYWGPSFSDEQIADAVETVANELTDLGCQISRGYDDAALAAKCAASIAEGKVVGWFQGRMEWGPRALGNRSILADPRRADMKDLLNLKIKRRESFRPFAPSIAVEHVRDWFEEYDDVPFMMKVFQIREDKRGLIPAVCHVDGSGRLQTVTKEANPLYHAVITQFNALTGVPMVLNTSFNENEPVVCAPTQAIHTFMRTKMDILFLGSTVLERQPDSHDTQQSAALS